PITPTVVGEEEEEFFLEDRSSNSSAEFVLMLDRANRRKESTRVENRISEVLEPRAVKLIPSRFDRIVLGTLPVEFHSGSAGFHLKLLYRLDRDSQADRAAFALLNRICNGNAFDEHVLGKALGAVDRSPPITL